jgi:hypothetical protein
MREETSVVRVKLNITESNTADVKNLWMSLNYNQKPTIAHVIEHIRKHFLKLDDGCDMKKDDFKVEDVVKLYLEDYWLPPYENSRLLRENDCIK